METKKIISKAIMIVLVVTFCIGLCAAESLVENGYYVILLVLVFAPFAIGYGMKKFGYLDWLDEKEIK